MTLALDALPGLREATHSDIDVAAAGTLGELAGVDAVRLGISEDLKPVRPEDVFEARRATRVFELRMPPSPALVKVALEARPDRVLFAAGGRDGRAPSAPLDLRARARHLESVARVLVEAGIPLAAVIPPNVEAVKAAHARQVPAVELHTALIVDLPPRERRAELERLADAVRLASKLGLSVGLGGGLGYRSLPDLLAVAPAVEWVAVGRAALSRAMLVGLDRALRDLRALVA